MFFQYCAAADLGSRSSSCVPQMLRHGCRKCRAIRSLLVGGNEGRVLRAPVDLLDRVCFLDDPFWLLHVHQLPVLAGTTFA